MSSKCSDGTKEDAEIGLMIVKMSERETSERKYLEAEYSDGWWCQ
jgi:hypothetical protein